MSANTYEVGGIRYDSKSGEAFKEDKVYDWMRSPQTASPIADGGTAASEAQGIANAVKEPVEQAMAPVKEVNQQIGNNLKSVGEGAEKAAPPMKDLAPATEATKSAMEGATSAVEAIPPKVEAALVGAATTAGQAIATAAQGLADALRNAATSIKNAASASGGAKAETKYDGKGGKMMPLAAAIAKERQMMPAGANLVIANSSETVIPAFAGHMGDGFKNLSFEEMESAAGFNRMKTYTEQIGEIADKTAATFSMGGCSRWWFGNSKRHGGTRSCQRTDNHIWSQTW